MTRRADPLARLAGVERLLVGCDFDGTLSPIVEDPDAARPDPDALGALEALARLPRTTAAIVSGRSIEALGRLTGLDGSSALRLVGSHGAEHGGCASLSDPQRRLVAELERDLRAAASDYPGAVVEPKPTGVAFHYRRVSEDLRGDAARAAREGAGARPGVTVREGRMVVELLAFESDKGEAVERLRRETDASGTLFVGDDRTDEDAFRRLGAGDLGVKVGQGETAAGLRIAGQPDVAPLLERLLDLRRRVTAGP